MTAGAEKRLLQLCIVVGSAVPILAGASGMIYGMEILAARTDISLDSHVRYLSGILCAIGLAFLAAVPDIERRGYHVRLLTFLVVIGGFARLAGAVSVGMPSTPMVLAIAMELIVTPALCLWQARVARRLGPAS